MDIKKQEERIAKKIIRELNRQYKLYSTPVSVIDITIRMRHDHKIPDIVICPNEMSAKRIITGRMSSFDDLPFDCMDENGHCDCYMCGCCICCPCYAIPCGLMRMIFGKKYHIKYKIYSPNEIKHGYTEYVDPPRAVGTTHIEDILIGKHIITNPEK